MQLPLFKNTAYFPQNMTDKIQAKMEARKMKAPATNSNYLSSNTTTHLVKEAAPDSCPLTSMSMLFHTKVPTYS